LTCEQCNRFNNFDFKGWQRWSDYEEVYTQWSKLVELRAITVMGGEPTLNATLGDWIQGLNRLFDVKVQILTNGTRFRHIKHLYPLFIDSVGRYGMNNHIGVSLHLLDEIDSLLADIEYFAGGPIQILPKGQNHWGSDWEVRDSNGLLINIYKSNEFGNSAIKIAPNGRHTLHDTDPILSHQNCAFVRWKSYHFIRGNLYKCGPAALLPEFDQQHHFDISDQDREILHSYRALNPDNFLEYHQEFFDNLDNPIAQCKFCPATHDAKLIYPVKK
jgi:hypothetical protein